MSEVHIRPAMQRDLETVVAFNLALALESEDRRLDPATVHAGVALALADPQLGRYFMAEIANQPGNLPPVAQPAGQLLITTEWSDWRNGLFWWIQSVYVGPAHRQAGVYRALHRHVETTARQTPGVCGLRLYVDTENTRAQQVYQRLGMSPANYILYEADWSPATPSRAS